MKPKTISSIKAMQEFAKEVVKRVKQIPASNHALVIALTGDLGSGKTTFTREFAQLLGVKQLVISPTFLIFRPYQISKKAVIPYTHLYHVDLYRIDHDKELIPLGFKALLKNPNYIVVIEWAEKIKKLLPKSALWIEFQHGVKESERIVVVREK